MDSEKPPMNEIKGVKQSSEWKMDTKGYFLIDPQPEQGKIYAHFYTKNKTYQCSISGTNAEEVYYTILREELITSLLHAAYIGSELQKAEIYMKHHIGSYVQDEPLHISIHRDEEE